MITYVDNPMESIKNATRNKWVYKTVKSNTNIQSMKLNNNNGNYQKFKFKKKMHLKADKNMKYLGVNQVKICARLEIKPQNTLREIKNINET